MPTNACHLSSAWTAGWAWGPAPWLPSPNHITESEPHTMTSYWLIHGFLILWFLWFYGLMVYGFTVLWLHGFMALWFYSFLVASSRKEWYGTCGGLVRGFGTSRKPNPQSHMPAICAMANHDMFMTWLCGFGLRVWFASLVQAVNQTRKPKPQINEHWWNIKINQSFIMINH